MLRTFLDDWRRHTQSGKRVMFALVVYRFGRYAMSVKLWPLRKLLGLIYIVFQPPSSLLGGLDMYRDTQVGDSPHFIHGGNIHIHPDAVIGDRVGIMHGVTIGHSSNTDTRLPVIGDDVFLGCNCSVLGGVEIGDRATIASNSLVLSDVPADSMAIGVPAKCIPKRLQKG